MSDRTSLPLSRPATAGYVTAPPLLLAAAAILMVLRTPAVLTGGRFWAEEGVVYFRDALLGSWYDALLAPRVGYFSAFNKIAALAATAVPLELAPLVTVYAALAVQLTVLWFVAVSDAFSRPMARLLGVAVVLFAVPSEEVWLNTINSQFYFATGAALLLVTSPGAIPTPLRLGFLALAGATGPVSAFLAPLFAWKAWRRPSRLAYAELAIIGLCAVVQAWLVARGLLEGQRAGSFQIKALICTFGIKLIALPWLGTQANAMAAAFLSAQDHMAHYRTAAVLAGVGGLVAVVVASHPVSRMLTAAAAALAVPSFAGALGADPWLLVLPLVGGRYAYAPNALMGLAVLVVLMSPLAARWRRGLALALLAGFLVHGVTYFTKENGMFSGPDWRSEVANWRADPSRTTIGIWPSGWHVSLPHDHPAAAGR
ncbi:hypothetical protein [Azospirillum thermophilum]|uniref:DUF2029 domain-containing protein n=1 Tax=Azospirillum thermophilum TaxID=2202148 RepID=A0A2S2D0C2_9PROT|nr:hypothetical protein [Azospirillum thermophilum]AWK90209.1 hypothetical protein DEW08_29795 [Azospirillum thermophilum]